MIVCLVWSILDRRRTEYDRLGYWLRLIVRYYVASAALSYGIIKIFALQMPFPTTSQLATPLGDLLPMRFSWLFIGYSVPYQMFSGVMETVAGLLLLNRRTVTAGLFAATGAFVNVVMINLAYDVPVKLYAMHLLSGCLFLLALDAPRLVNFLVLNRATPPTNAYTPNFTKPWQRWGSMAVKVYIVFQLLILPLSNGWTRYKTVNCSTGCRPAQGWCVRRAALCGERGRDPRQHRGHHSMEGSHHRQQCGGGSVNTLDGLFQQRYRRGYFRYKADTTARTATVWKTSTIPGDSTFLFTMRYEVPDTSSIRLHAVIRGDTVQVDLKRMARHFQLTERQFHWLSEYNR